MTIGNIVERIVYEALSGSQYWKYNAEHRVNKYI
jgi:hypothetical protein